MPYQKMLRYAALSIIGISLSHITLFAQTDLPRVVPPSPESASLFRFQDYPVGTSTGIPEISIPLFSLRSGSLNLPVSMSYHAGGRQVFDQTGPIGIGWTLMAGGRVSRTIYGKPDDETGFPATLRSANSIDLNNYQDFDYIANTYGGNSEYDIFSFTCGNIGGKYFLSNNNIVQMPLSSTQITCGLDFFPTKIVDDKGTEYRFEQRENYQSVFPYRTTSKLLTSIISADRKDTITLSYQPFNYSDAKRTASLVITDDDNRSTNPPNPAINYQVNSNFNQYVIQRLTEIRFKSGRLVFALAPSSDQISSIQLYNNAGQLLRSVDFSRFVMDSPSFTGNANCQEIDGLFFKDATGQIAQKYAFTYQPSYDFSGQDRDFWGYLNRESSIGNTKMVPNYTAIPYRTMKDYGWLTYTFQGGNRNAQPTTAGVIKKIYYPSGGNTEFFFERNMCKKINGDAFVGPGLRIAKIKTSDNNGKVTLKTYKYGVGEDGYGTLPGNYIWEESTYSREMSNEMRYITSWTDGASVMRGYRVRTYSSELLPQVSEIYNIPVFYNRIAVYEGDLNRNNGKTVFNFSPGMSHSEGSLPSPALTPGSTRANYNAYLNSFAQDPNIIVPYTSQFNYFQGASRLIGTETYKNVNNSFEKVASTGMSYMDSQTANYRGMYIYKQIEGFGNRAPDNLPVYRYADYFISTGTSRLSSQSESVIENGSEIKKQTDFTYNNNELVSQTQTTRSNGDIITTTTKYPFDQTGPVNSLMLARNMINYGVEVETKKGTQTLSLVNTSYKDWGNEVIAPEVVSLKTGNGAAEPRVVYSGYITQYQPSAVAKAGGPLKVYLYGYANELPIAEATNTTLSRIAFANFESDQTGNWIYAASGLVTSDARTGKRSFQSTLTSGTLPAGNYSVSLWAKGSGSVSVNGVDKNITNNWKLYEWAVNSPGTVSVNANGNRIDDVRLSPAESQMTTYTYEPLKGLTSATDPKGLTTFYSYDDFQRLSTIRDESGNIKKQFNYNQTNPSFYSYPVNVTLQKNGCPPGYYGETLTYSLDAGAFTSNVSQEEANLAAARDLATNGQRYVNENGRCLQYYSDYQSRWIQKNDCSLGQEVLYEVPANKYTSAISTDDANQKAINEINALGQAWANAHGVCLTEPYKSNVVEGMVSRACSSGYVPSPAQVNFRLEAGSFTSLRSVADATDKAGKYWGANSVAYAEQHSSCNIIGTKSFSVFNGTSYTFTIRLSNGTDNTTYSVSSGSSTTISFPAYENIYVTISTAACGSCTFRFTCGTQVVNGGLGSFTVNSANPANSINIGNGIAN
ncbi:DUF5977 domain-containing protein [Mucilaginibacter lutimaris]|uniref:DUF5977 domain-containing protein n=1 Tax=Mucilaginibacter lutimaris TaxID=931629 RepID=A0ABW2ZIU4_9SPHI